MTVVKEFLNFSGLYGEKNHAVLPDFIHSESLVIRCKTYNWEIEEHLHNDLYQVFFILEGDGEILTENKSITLKAPCLVTVPAGMLHGFHFSPSIVGRVTTLSESYLEAILSNHPYVIDQIQQLHIYTLKHNSEELEDTIYLLDKIGKELGESDNEKLALQSLLHLLFISVYRLAQVKKSYQISASNPSLKIFQEFQKLIRKSIHETKSVSAYARQLNITTIHLNRVCQTVGQQSALKLIHQKVIDEAKKYLLNTEYSVSEIGYLLDFRDPAHFSKLFKKYVGVTPTEFRKN